jgi:hypothetical protein
MRAARQLMAQVSASKIVADCTMRRPGWRATTGPSQGSFWTAAPNAAGSIRRPSTFSSASCIRAWTSGVTGPSNVTRQCAAPSPNRMSSSVGTPPSSKPLRKPSASTCSATRSGSRPWNASTSATR